MKRAVVTGITGQDGAYLAEHLLSQDYVVYGTYRKSQSPDFWRISFLGIQNHPHLHLLEFDLTSLDESIDLLKKTMPDEVYNLAADSSVGEPYKHPHETMRVNGLGPLNLLEAIRVVNSRVRFFQASSAEIFAKAIISPQSEDTPACPRNPYGAAKLYAQCMVDNYRDHYGIHGSNAILFNHESPLRGLEFVTRKITNSIAKIKLNKLDVLELGNMDARRDWGFAGDYVKAMHLMLQADHGDTYVLATNRAETVRDFVSMSCKAADIAIEWHGSGVDEVAIERLSGKEIVRVNPKFYRPVEVGLLVGDTAKIESKLGWNATTSLESLCALMVHADIQRVMKEK